MSLTTDGLALGAAFAIAVGSAVQAEQAYTELNAKTPASTSVIPLLLITIWTMFIAMFIAVAPWTRVRAATLLIAKIQPLAELPAELTRDEFAALPSGQAAVLAPGKPTALTADQAKALAEGDPVTLTSDQRGAMAAGRVGDIKKWLGLLLGWLFILLGALPLSPALP